MRGCARSSHQDRPVPCPAEAPAIARNPAAPPAPGDGKAYQGEGLSPSKEGPPIGIAAERKPEWLKVRVPAGDTYARVKGLVHGLGLATVCEEARCPNVGECWGSGTMTLMLMGDTCTRGCRFCHVRTAREGRPLDPSEPHKVSMAVSQLGLDYVVLTMVDRDDLPDQGAEHVARTIEGLKRRAPRLLVEMLTGDFRGERACVERVVRAKPDVYAHNLETVERLTPTVRDARAGYRQSLGVLRLVKELDPSRFTKSSLMLGLGETDAEVEQAMRDLRAVDCDILTLGQYLRPSARHLEVRAYVPPARFDALAARAKELGFLYCAAGPLVRSSYKAGEFFVKGLLEQRNAQAGSR
jgi:lipoic acid synthetase